MSLKGEKVLVTGASGLIGAALVKRLLAEGAHVRATVHRKPLDLTDSNLETLAGDLTRGDDCRAAAAGVKYVFHCAANSSGAAAISATPMIHVTPNVLINTQLLDAAYSAGVSKFLWISSTTGYPPTGERPTHEDEMFQGDPFEKYFFVGWMKRFTEVLCRMYGEKLPRK